VFSVGLFEDLDSSGGFFSHLGFLSSKALIEEPQCMLFQVQRIRCRYVLATGLPLFLLVIVKAVQGPVPQPGEEDGENQHQHTPRLGGRELCPPGTAQQQMSVLLIGSASKLILKSIFNYYTVRYRYSLQKHLINMQFYFP
jgi:hypothetical protein